jgi:glycosyltransferase involved in cell wall biosynthesis
MRILVLAKASSVHTARWVNALAKREHEVILASIHEFSQPLVSSVRRLRLPYSPPLGYFLASRQLKRALQRIGPDLLHAHYASGYGTLARLARFRPTLLSVWGSDVYDFPRQGAMAKLLLRANLLYADGITSTSKAMAVQTQRLVKPRLDIEVVPFGVETGVFSPSVKERDSREIRIGTVKALSGKYGVDTLIRAYALVWCRLRERNETRSLSLNIFGEGPDREVLERLAQDSVPGGSVQFHGLLPHVRVPEALRDLDIFVALSRLESFGVSILEAGACGLPVVAAAVGGLKEVVVDGRTGILVPPDDPEAAASAMLRLVDNPGLRQNMGRAGRALVEATYEWSQCVDTMEAVYARMRSRLEASA